MSWERRPCQSRREGLFRISCELTISTSPVLPRLKASEQTINMVATAIARFEAYTR